jgi:anti-sigma factor ChrR (cupin superfamily)
MTRGATFAAHPHPCGEETFVLDGIFSDEHGDYPAGTFLLNPEGFTHAPFSREGCVLFIKLQQYAGAEHIAIDTKSAAWPATGVPGLALMTLYDDEQGDTIRLARFDRGCRVPAHDHEGGEEISVIEGELTDEHGTYPAETWLRQPDGSFHDRVSPGGATLYVKRGHLPPL